MNIELESLLGEHELSGAFHDAVNEPEYTGCDRTCEKQVLRFTLDGTHYEAVEDLDDGPRGGGLGELRTTEIAPANVFAPVKVIGRMKPKSEEKYSGEDRILQFLNARTGAAIIEIGTTDVNDYYPGYTAYFSPEHLS